MKLLDTSVLVDIDRGDIDRKVQTLDAEGRHAISMVSVTERRLGGTFDTTPKQRPIKTRWMDLNGCLARLEIVPVSWPVATAAEDIIGTVTERGEALNDLHDVKRNVATRLLIPLDYTRGYKHI